MASPRLYITEERLDSLDREARRVERSARVLRQQVARAKAEATTSDSPEEDTHTHDNRN
jgi:hypothetical protein